MHHLPFEDRLQQLKQRHAELIRRPNPRDEDWYNGVFERFQHPVVTANHTPLAWRFDLDPESNPRLLERLGINAAFNAGAIERDGKVLLVVRVEGVDRKSFFAVAESVNGIDQFKFWDRPVVMPETDRPDTTVYDMRLTAHADCHLYGLFCTERKDENDPDLSAAEAQCGICRTKDLKTWSASQTCAHPRRSNAMSSFIRSSSTASAGCTPGRKTASSRPARAAASGGASATRWKTRSWTMNPLSSIDGHTTPSKKSRMARAPPPIRTDAGWLHLAHGVRGSATGLRYVLYMFMTDLDEPWRVTHAPGGHFLAPRCHERAGDLYSVALSNGWVARTDGSVLIYYATNDTQTYVARSDLPTLVDYVTHTPPDAGRSLACVQQRLDLMANNLPSIQ